MEISKFAIPEIIHGRGSLNYAGQCALRLGARKVFPGGDFSGGRVLSVYGCLTRKNFACPCQPGLTFSQVLGGKTVIRMDRPCRSPT